ncbi:MAG: regulatory protein RecX [Clostridia bacterium]|nr:regulatory protein RecX [Clostridia bacterium]
MLLTYEKGRADKIHISIDGTYTMTVDATYWYGLGIKNKTEINEEELAQLKSRVNSRRAFNKAIELISRREHSRKEIVTKLTQRGFAEVAEDVADELERLDYLDDERFAGMYAKELKQRKSMGKRRIAQELYLKGISRDIIEIVTEEINESPVEEIIEIINRKYLRYLGDEKGRTRTVNALVRLGYGYSDIKNALNTVSDEVDNLSDMDYD